MNYGVFLFTQVIGSNHVILHRRVYIQHSIKRNFLLLTRQGILGSVSL